MNDKELIKVAHQWFERMWSIPDLSLVDKLVDPEYHPQWILINKKGSELIKHEIKYFRSIFPDLSYTIVDIFAQNNKVWVRYKAYGTHKGIGWGFNPTNKNVEFEGCAILYFNEVSKVIDLWESYCFYDILEQLKVVPPLWDLHKYFQGHSQE
jgi:predicted ester cyclase